MKNIKLTLQYEGTNYSGWQIQKKESTVQGLLENAVRAVTGEHSKVTGAGRTDAGVHAIEQVASFRTRAGLEPGIILRALNANLPHDIRIVNAEEAGDDFHPRYSAKQKTYVYLITLSGSYSVFLNKYSWNMHYKLNFDPMANAAEYLTGRHDFSSFRASGCGSKNPIREIMEIAISKNDALNFMNITFNTPIITIRIKGNAFLRHMVRNIAGTLVKIGRNKISPEQIQDILEAKDRRAAGPTAPACGLFLEKIDY